MQLGTFGSELRVHANKPYRHERKKNTKNRVSFCRWKTAFVRIGKPITDANELKKMD